MKKASIFISFTIVLILSGCGSSTPANTIPSATPSATPTATPSATPSATPTATPVPSKPPNNQHPEKMITDNEVKEILNGLIPKAVAIYGTFNGTGVFQSDATKTIPDEKDYCLVTGRRQQNGNGKSPVDIMDNVKSIADLKKVIEDVFTKDIAEKVFYSRYLTPDKRPLYKDYEGKLYQDTKHGGHGWAEKFLIDTAKLKGQKDNVAQIELDKTSLDFPPEKLTISIEYVNDKWLMASPLVK